MIISIGEKLHIVTRRRFEEDIRRHFAGVVSAAEGTIVRVEGYVFLFDKSKNQFLKMPEKRCSVFDIAAEGYIANILPENAVIEGLNYKVSDRGNLIFTDNQQFSMVINEFGVKR